MAEDAAGGRERLLRRYRELVGDQLPRAAARGSWTLRADHCFGRVLLDDAVGGCWYDVLDRRAGRAHRQLTDAQLERAVTVGEQILVDGDPLLRELDAQSLRWRGKPPKRGAGGRSGERPGETVGGRSYDL